MDPIEEHLDVLQNIESVVVEVWRNHSAMTNYTVMRAYETAIAYYSALAREQSPKPVNLTGLDATLFEAVKDVCEWRLGRGAESDGDEVSALPVEVLVSCLRKLRKSVDRWTREGGRQGYLQFIEKFLP